VPEVDGRAPEDMAWIPGGEFRMGSTDWYPEERPVHTVAVDGFWMDDHAVTVAEFGRFVEATGYVTLAERPLDPDAYPDVDPSLLVPGALVFRRTTGPVDLRDIHAWWAYVPGASWDHPGGLETTIVGLDRHPVTQVAWEDAVAYAGWADKELPTEAEWEFAARGGLQEQTYAWGDEFAPDGRMMANTWQGEFPWQNLLLDRYEGTAPVKTFPPNGYGLFEVCGNVWEWTADYYTPRHPDEAEHSCCAPRNPRVTDPDGSFDTGHSGPTIPRRVTKGGSLFF